jgi:hypothetical protein
VTPFNNDIFANPLQIGKGEKPTFDNGGIANISKAGRWRRGGGEWGDIMMIWQLES